MSFRKGLLFATVVIGIGFAPVVAQGATSPLTTISAYNYTEDPFLLEWTLREKSPAAPAEKKELTQEEKILLRWKTKQAKLWEQLPTEPFIVNASAYTAAADECGKSDGITASGLKVTEKRTLACPKNFPFGTKIKIEGMGEYRCEDRGGAIKGNKIDIYVETKSEAFAFGRQNREAQVVR